MTRDDYLEVAIRVLGLYAWLQAAFAAVSAVAATPVLAYTLAASPGPHPQLTPLSGVLGGLAFSLVKCASLFLLGRYLISDGRWVLQKVRSFSGAGPTNPAA